MTGRIQGLLLFTAVLGLATGCGAGVVGVVASAGGGGSSNAPPGISGFQVVNPKVPPAHLLFTLADPEGQPATVEFLAEVEDGPREHLAKVRGLAANPATLATSRDGTAYDLEWDFAAESFLPDDAHFVRNVTVIALLAGSTEVVPGANAVQLGMGNDAPRVTAIEPVTGEPSGIVGIELRVEDSSDDVVSVRVEYDLANDVPDAGFRLARPALAEPTPDFGIENVQVDDLGTTLSFFWDTNVDLAELERDVVLRFTAKDEIVEGASLISNLFRVDNNAAPIVQLFNDLVVTNDDELRGIPCRSG